MSADTNQSVEKPVAIDHVVDFYRAYPGETLTFYTRVRVQKAIDGYTLHIHLPKELEIQSYHRDALSPNTSPRIHFDEDGQHMVWEHNTSIKAGSTIEYQTKALVAPTLKALDLTSRATVVISEKRKESAQEVVSVAVFAKGRYLKNLPALYESDEFMGRFLMLFESFWKPIEQRADNIWDYLDPKMAPPDLLPWLASWLNLVLDERWPEAKRRKLIRSALYLYRKRGTQAALETFLEIYTGVKPTITERQAHNFTLGSEAHLGLGLALGSHNQPHTITVTVRVPPIPVSGNPQVDEQKAQERRRIIEQIIETEKPAHVAYTLQIETLSQN